MLSKTKSHQKSISSQIVKWIKNCTTDLIELARLYLFLILEFIQKKHDQVHQILEYILCKLCPKIPFKSLRHPCLGKHLIFSKYLKFFNFFLNLNIHFTKMTSSPRDFRWITRGEIISWCYYMIPWRDLVEKNRRPPIPRKHTKKYI